MTSVRASISDQDLDFKQPRSPTSSAAKYTAPTEEENLELRKVAGNVPSISFSLCVVEFAECASYYDAKTVFLNFVQRHPPEGEIIQDVIICSVHLTLYTGGNGAGAPP